MAVGFPVGPIRAALLGGEVIPFLGAGASLIKSDDPTASRLPSGAELANLITREAGFEPSDETMAKFRDLAFAASYYQNCSGNRNDLRKALHGFFEKRVEPGPIHRFLARIEKTPIIFTTNYDDLIEQAFEEEGREFHLVVYPADELEKRGMFLYRKSGETAFSYVKPSDLPIGEGRGSTIIYKMHGTWTVNCADNSDPETQKLGHYVISEEDYTKYLAKKTLIPPIIAARMRKMRFLFLGYGLGDWNFRVMLHNLGKYGQPRPTTGAELGDDNFELPALGNDSWAIMKGATLQETELWQTKKLKICNVDINDAVAALDNTISASHG